MKGCDLNDLPCPNCKTVPRRHEYFEDTVLQDMDVDGTYNSQPEVIVMEEQPAASGATSDEVLAVPPPPVEFPAAFGATSDEILALPPPLVNAKAKAVPQAKAPPKSKAAAKAKLKAASKAKAVPKAKKANKGEGAAPSKAAKGKAEAPTLNHFIVPKTVPAPVPAKSGGVAGSHEISSSKSTRLILN